jgi:dienelactone hydrolase
MPSLLPGFEYDIFISYRQKDNKYDGWVTEFVANLKKELEATFKDDVSIYFDENPHDGLLETHNVNRSLEGKLKCLIIVPIISQTYCDPKSFAWQHEFVAFHRQIQKDTYGVHIKVANGNIASRILPVRIHDLDPEDVALFEGETGEVMRPVDFIYRLPGVNRQLRAKDDEQIKSPNQLVYRDQINKVANAIKDIIGGMKAIHRGLASPAKPAVADKPIEQPISRPEPAKVVESVEKGRRSRVPFYALVALALVAVSYLVLPDWLNKRRARNEILPAIQLMVDSAKFIFVPSRAFELAQEAAKHIPDDSALIKMWPKISRAVDIDTEPSGAAVYWVDYERPSDPWKLLGTTPLVQVRVPFNVRYKFEKPGYQTVLVTSGRIGLNNQFKLDSIGTLPEGMVRVRAGSPSMYIIGLEQNGGKPVGEFLVDQYEVTNASFKTFVDAGGYSKPDFWKQPILEDGKPLPWSEAMKRFVDRTGRPGPSTWEAGSYPDGKADHPVAGVSWYEAAAYAEFSGKQLPTVFHWGLIAETNRTLFIIPQSNFNGRETMPVGANKGISSFGIYDLAGNVREWCSSKMVGQTNHYFSLGGGFNDPTFAFNDAYGGPALDRSPGNGFRCIQTLPGDTTLALITPPVAMAFRDYNKEKPVDDKTFALFARQFDYDNTPLNAEVKQLADTGIWKVERVTMDAAYGDDRLVTYLFLPKNAKPPYQPILFYPGSNVIYLDELKSINIRNLDFLLKSGRAIVLPIFKGTFERRDELNSDLADETVFYKEHVIMWRKDVGRSLDYLATRDDMRMDKVGFFGWSWGGFMGGIIPAVEPRIKALVLHVGGMEMNKSLPEVDQINFLPRVKQPVLMLNGKHDMFFHVEASQKPMFRMLGTSEQDKKIIIYDAGHLVPRPELIKETLAWFDRYLGPTN